jgi:ComF family protein
MARLMAKTLAHWAPAVDAIVHVPLSGGRRRGRGYDQSELLAREVARLSGLPLLKRALVRRRATLPQSGRPDYEARLENVAGAFVVRGGSLPPRLLLVDDVVTTGATIDECARVLREAGVEAVYALTFARED